MNASCEDFDIKSLLRNACVDIRPAANSKNKRVAWVNNLFAVAFAASLVGAAESDALLNSDSASKFRVQEMEMGIIDKYRWDETCLSFLCGFK